MLVESPPTASRSETNFVLFFLFFFFQSGICFRCRLDNPRHFPNFQLPAIGVTADFYILHFLDNRIARSQTSWVLQSTLALSICSHFSFHTLKVFSFISICPYIHFECNMKYVLFKCCFRWRKFDKRGIF